MTEYLRAAKIAIIIGDTLIIHGAIHTYNMGYVTIQTSRRTERKRMEISHSTILYSDIL